MVDGYQYKKNGFTSYVGTCQFGGSVGMTDAVKRSQDKAKAAGAQFVFGQAGVAPRAQRGRHRGNRPYRQGLQHR